MKRIAAVVMTGLVGGALLLTGSADATAARTAPTVSIDSAVPRDFAVLGFRSVHAVFKVTSDAPTVTLTVTPPEGTSATLAKNPTGHQKGQSWSFLTTFESSDPIGQWHAVATATGAGNSTATDTFDFYVFHASRIVDFRVHPRIVRKGYQVYFSGRLQYLVNRRWQGLGDVPVSIVQGRDVVTTVTTDSEGRFTAQVTADHSALFYALFKGLKVETGDTSRSTAPARSRKVFVKVIHPRVVR